MLHKDNCKPIREAFEFLDLVRLISEILRYVSLGLNEMKYFGSVKPDNIVGLLLIWVKFSCLFNSKP